MDIIIERIIERMGPRHGAAKELAEHLGIHPNVITNWKNGSLRSYTKYLGMIADYFGVTRDYLEGKVDEPYQIAIRHDMSESLGGSASATAQKEKPATDEGDGLTTEEAAIAYFKAEKGRNPTEEELGMFRAFTKPVLDSLPDKAE